MGRKPRCSCGECPTCKARVASRERYQNMSVEERRAFVARRDPEKVKAADRARYQRDKEKRRAAMDEYARNHPAEMAANKKRWAERNVEKVYAQITLNNAVRDGKVTKLPCSVCGSTTRIHGHHYDYTKPLEVVWFCPEHHSEIHREQREEARRLLSV